MGRSPDIDNFVEGDECGDCIDVIFDDFNPKFIMALTEGIVSCPIAPVDWVNGSYLLTQNAGDPCQYDWAEGNLDILLQFGPGGATMEVHFLGVNHYFNDLHADDCGTLFTNEITDCLAGDFGHSGTVSIFWGSGVGP